MNKKATTKKTASKKPSVDEVLEKVDAKIEASGEEKVTFEAEGQGREAQRAEEADKYAQQDYIPGTRMRDMLQLPEFVYDDHDGVRRRAFNLKTDEFHYCWVEGSDITRFKFMGYRMVPYNGGRGGLARPGFSGTGMYECDLSNHIKLGDSYLMYCEQRLYEDLTAADRAEADRMERLGQNNFHNLGYRHGWKTFEEKDGVVLSN